MDNTFGHGDVRWLFDAGIRVLLGAMIRRRVGRARVQGWGVTDDIIAVFTETAVSAPEFLALGAACTSLDRFPLPAGPA